MPITTRHLMLDSLLLLMAASLVVVGANGLILHLLVFLYSPLHLLLSPVGFLTMLLTGLGGLAWLVGWHHFGRGLGVLLATLLAAPLIADQVSSIDLQWSVDASLTPISSLLLMPAVVCLILGGPSGRLRWVWLLWGSAVIAVGLGALLLLLSGARPTIAPAVNMMQLAQLIMVGVVGAMVVSGALRERRTAQLGRYALLVGFTGVVISSLAWLLLSWQQETVLDRQADYLLDNIQLNAEQVMTSRLTLMRRMADRLDAGGGAMDPVILERDLQGYLQDTASLLSVGLYRGESDWAWLAGRDPDSQAELVRLVGLSGVEEWLGYPIVQPRVILPDHEALGTALLAIELTGSGQQLLSLIDLSGLLAHELRLQLGLYRIVVQRRGEVMLELQQPGISHHQEGTLFVNHLLQRRYVGLPGGPMLTLEAYPGVHHDWVLSGLMPVGVGGAGLLLSGMLAFSLALAIERYHSARRLRILERSVEGSPNGVVIADARKPDLPIIYVNPAFERMSGFTKADVLGRNYRILQGPDTDAKLLQQLFGQLVRGEEAHATLRTYRKDGTSFWNDIDLSPVRDGQGRITHYVGIQSDASERMTHEAELAYNASHDALTGLANRSLFEDRLEHDLALAVRRGERLAVLFVDLDDLKPINDTLGHAVGDEVLRQVAGRLETVVRDGDTVSRLGGDEFVLLILDVVDEEQVLRVVERLMTAIARPYRVNGHELYLTCSIGIALSDASLDEPRELIQQADMAMYQAKQQGRNAYHWYTEAITERLSERVALRNDLQEAIDTEQLALHYQPLLDRSGSLAGVEALLRWEHPVRGSISPGDFIPLAESTGQIIPLSAWVLERACRDMVGLGKMGLGRVRVSVNLSPLQFHRPHFLASLREVLHKTGMPAPQLILELTEGILMDSSESAIDLLHALRGMQIGVAIDDFGTGYSSLSYLRDLPINGIKIDRSFIAGVTENRQDAAIVQGMISMARHLGLKVVAEGVETEIQREQLAAWGCDLFQGYLLARPMPLEALAHFVAELAPSGR